MNDIEEFEDKALAAAHAAYAKLSSDAQADFLKAYSWAEHHIGTAVLFGAIAGAGLVLFGLKMLGLLAG